MMIVEESQDTSTQWSKPNESSIFGNLKIEMPRVKDSKPGLLTFSVSISVNDMSHVAHSTDCALAA
jgi:hypothetical protein